MENTIAPAPAFSFNEQSITDFDARMEKIGFIYEGTFDNCVWIYRKSKTQSVTIQVGFGGVLSVRVYESDYTGSVIKNTKIDLGDIQHYITLVKKIDRIVENN
jgi:hypothetical protein